MANPRSYFFVQPHFFTQNAFRNILWGGGFRRKKTEVQKFLMKKNLWCLRFTCYIIARRLPEIIAKKLI